MDLSTFKQDFDSSSQNKELYGEVHTDFALINKMLDLIPLKYYSNPKLTWLDPCCGRGYFTIILYKKLFSSLEEIIPHPLERHNHIISKMIYMIEINSSYIPILKNLFGENSNIYHENFLDWTHNRKFNFIIGNPPFNCNGLTKVPTNTLLDKTQDGKSIWQSFIQKAFSLLAYRGFLVFITPSIWMKNDHPMFKHMLQYKIKKLHTMTNTETNKIFHGQAQTPTCYFLIMKMLTHKYPKYRPVNIYDKSLQKYIKYNISAFEQHYKLMSLPLFAISIIQKLQKYMITFQPLKVIKTSMRPDYKGLDISSNQSKQFPFPNISTCKLNLLKPELIINYSNIVCIYHGIPKLVLAHKMYGFPYYDKEGKYGISNRDNYVILNKNDKDFMRLKQFLSTKLILTLFEATRYRMKYLEKHIFDMIPDITRIPDFPEEITDKTISKFFKLNKAERNLINTFHKKQYVLDNF